MRNREKQTGGQFNLKIVKMKGTSIYSVNTTVNYGCTTDQLKIALNLFDAFSTYSIDVVSRQIYNGTN